MAAEQARKTVFVISPIGRPGTVEHKNAMNVLKFIVKKAFDGDAWEVHRADSKVAPDSITNRVIKRIAESDMIVADLTDHNPNVFYELAVAHGFQKPVIHIITNGQAIPFDVNDQRAIFYDLTDPESVDLAIERMAEVARWLEEHPGEGVSPLSGYAQFKTISGDDDAGAAVAEAIERLTSGMNRLEWKIANLSSDYPGREVGGSPREAINLIRRIEHLGNRIAAVMSALAPGDEIPAEIAEMEEQREAFRRRLMKIQDRNSASAVARRADPVPLRV